MDSGRLDAVPGAVHLDTVRSLHQTVVSLRTALELSKNELKDLKEKYEKHSLVDYTDVIEKLTLENHILRRRIIDTDYVDETRLGQNIKLEVTYSPRKQQDTDSEVVIKTATSDIDSEPQEVPLSSEEEGEDTENLIESSYRLNESFEETHEEGQSVIENIEIESQIENTESPSPQNITQIEDPSHLSASKDEEHINHQSGYKTKLELLSKFDVRIKVRTIKEGTIISSTTSETDSSDDKDTKKKKVLQENKVHFQETEGNIKAESVSQENIRMAVPNEAEAKSKNDKFDVQVRITSEENLVVKEGYERSRRKDTLNLDVDDLSFRSLSEGDNSVFSEVGQTPDDDNTVQDSGNRFYEQENSGNESEEVDDIELIFTADESKDMSNCREDLVSIRSEDWSSPPRPSHSTPVLVKFHTLDPDFQPDTSERQDTKAHVAPVPTFKKRVSLPDDKDIKHGLNGRSDYTGRGILKSDNMLHKSPNTSTRRLDSVDSLTCEYNRNMSLDHTKSSSFELGSSMDILQRDESVDSFYKSHHLGHRFSVFAETDISKCGISEDDVRDLNVRRNTCPNPFQYRPPARGLARPAGPLKAPPRPRPAPPPRRAAAASSAAQTDLSALPHKWSSDGYLAHKAGLQVTLPAPPPPRAPPPRLQPPPPAPRAEAPRRQLLSDIGFTSMVPELSRSADPVWAMGQRACTCGAIDVAPPPLGSTSKYLSRGSYRSPVTSIDRSAEWAPQSNYAQPVKVSSRAWRNSLPDVRRDDTDELMEETDAFLRRSTDNLRATGLDYEYESVALSRPYIPAEARELRLGHAVKVITPQGRVAVGRVRYVGLAGGTAATSSVMVGCIFPAGAAGAAAGGGDGAHRGRRYFTAPKHHSALFVPFSKVVMAWAN